MIKNLHKWRVFIEAFVINMIKERFSYEEPSHHPKSQRQQQRDYYVLYLLCKIKTHDDDVYQNIKIQQATDVNNTRTHALYCARIFIPSFTQETRTGEEEY